MYLRHTTRREGRQGAHVLATWCARCAWGARCVQQTVAQLGELDAQGRARAQALARSITGGREQAELFAPTPEPGEPDCGPSGSGPPGTRPRLRRRLARLDAVASAAAGYAAASACCPSDAKTCRGRPWPRSSCWRGCASRRASCTSPRTGIGARRWRICSRVPAALVNDDRCYRALDRLLPHKTALEQHLVQPARRTLRPRLRSAPLRRHQHLLRRHGRGNPLAQRGHSRDHRPDCKQVCMALVVTREGMPLGYELFAGNKTDVTTVAGDRRAPWKPATAMAAAHLGHGSRHDQRRECRLAATDRRGAI